MQLAPDDLFNTARKFVMTDPPLLQWDLSKLQKGFPTTGRLFFFLK